MAVAIMDTMRDVEWSALWLRDQVELMTMAEMMPIVSSRRMLTELDAIVDYCQWALHAGMTAARPPTAVRVPTDDDPIRQRATRRSKRTEPKS